MSDSFFSPTPPSRASMRAAPENAHSAFRMLTSGPPRLPDWVTVSGLKVCVVRIQIFIHDKGNKYIIFLIT